MRMRGFCIILFLVLVLCVPFSLAAQDEVEVERQMPFEFEVIEGAQAYEEGFFNNDVYRLGKGCHGCSLYSFLYITNKHDMRRIYNSRLISTIKQVRVYPKKIILEPGEKGLFILVAVPTKEDAFGVHRGVVDLLSQRIGEKENITPELFHSSLLADLLGRGCFSRNLLMIIECERQVLNNLAFVPPIDTELPNVLIIGDSISIGYTTTTQRLLSGKADVFRIPSNGASTIRGLERIDEWLGDTPWDLIYFNFGLHDLKYIDENGEKIDSTLGEQIVTQSQYGHNLRKIIRRLQKTNAILIFATTTPIPTDTEGRYQDDVPAYNWVALKIMREEGVPVSDLYSHTIKEIRYKGTRSVHFNRREYDIIATKVAQDISVMLEQLG